MRLVDLRVVLSVIVLILMNSCSRFSDVIDLSSKNFGDEVALQQNLIFTFTEDVIPDSLIGAWTDRELIQFDPVVAGRFRFTTTRELIFSPVTGFDPSADYKATFTDQIVEYAPSGKPLTAERSLTFHTPYLRADRLDLFWSETVPGSGRPMLRASIVFNYQVDPEEVHSRLSMNMNGNPVSTVLLSNRVDNIIVVSIEGIDPQTSGGNPLTATIQAGLPCSECNNATGGEMSVSAYIGDINRLSILSADPVFEGANAMIRVRTNQRIAGTDVRSLIKTDPQVSVTAEVTNEGILIRGPFRSGSTYDLTISDQLQGVHGGRLESAYQSYVAFGAMEPSIQFTSSKGFYLSSKGAKTIGVEITNVPEVRVMVYKIYENNLLNYVNSNRYTNWNVNSSGSGTNFGQFGYNYYGIENYGDVIIDRTLDARDLTIKDGVNMLTLDLEEDSRYKGVYLVNVASTENQWIGSWRMVSYSDIGLIVKTTDDEAVIFANSIIDTKPMSGVEVTLISTNNQTMKSGTTDANGMVRISGLLKDAAGFRLGMVSAKQNNDFNIILLEDTRVENSRFDVGGQWTNPAGYQAFLYPERDIYRPGESIHLNAIIRDTNWGTPGKMPLLLQVRLPNGRELATQQQVLSDKGAAAYTIPLDASAVTGTYMAELYTSNRVLLASLPISVEEFLPDRIKVALDTDQKRVPLGGSVVSTITATNLFGPPAAFRNYEMSLNLQRMPFSSTKFPDVDFSLRVKDGIVLLSDSRAGKTDAKGQATETFTPPMSYSDMGLLRARLFATVFDESGRPVNQIQDVTIETQSIFYGIRQMDSYVDLSRPVTVGFVAVDKDGAPVPGTKGRVQVIRFEWQNVIQRNYDDRYRYVSQKKEIVVSDRIIDMTDGTHSFTFLPQVSGQYEIRVMRPGSEHWVANSFYAYGFGYTSGSSFEVDTDGQITVETDKENYAPGETAKLLFKTPFAGRLLVTVERNSVLETYTIETDKRAAVLDLRIKDEHVPNIYVAATLLKPVTDQSVPLTTAHGYHSISVVRSNSIIPITITAPSTSRSNRTQQVRVKAQSNSAVELTIAVVDEGILQLKNFVTPDPHAYFYAKRALEVRSFDVYPYLFPEMFGRSSFGGDGYDMSLRVNPMGSRRARLVSFWSGIVKTNNAGDAVYDIAIPSYSGQLRVMAVAWNGSAFGSAQHSITVADPIVISAALPRFMSPGDSLDMGLILTNTTNNQTQGTAAISVGGPARMSGTITKNISIPANSEHIASFGIVAERNIGEARIGISVRTSGETFSDTIYVPVRAASGLIKKSGNGQLDNKAVTINPGQGYIPATSQTRLLLSRSPLVAFTASLADLLAYPYGCAEQTISAAFPQLYYEDLSALLEQPGSRRPSDPVYNVQQAINKIETMQLYNGSLSYWPGGNYESWWATVYAAHFMQEAQRAGFDVNTSVLQRMYWYIETRNRERNTIRYYYNDENGLLVEKTIAPKEVAYGLYVLAMAGQPDLPGMNYYKDNVTMLALDSRYLLATAFMRIGDQASYKAVLPNRFAGEKSLSVTGGSFHSFIRDQGISLNAMLESDPTNPQIAPLVRQLSEQVAQARYLNTQEQAFALLAMGKFLRMEAGNTSSAKVTTGSTNLGSFTGEDLVLELKSQVAPITITSSGSGNVYYFWESKGLTTSETVAETDQVLKVRRNFLNRSGQMITSRRFKQNDLVVVRLTVNTLDGSSLDNVVVSDLLPAGFEIENPRIGDVPELQWVTNAAIADHIDIRDDRINLFTSADGNERHFYYLVRAVSKGRFFQGPVSADAMYNGAYHSYNGAGTIYIGD